MSAAKPAVAGDGSRERESSVMPYARLADILQRVFTRHWDELCVDVEAEEPGIARATDSLEEARHGEPV